MSALIAKLLEKLAPAALKLLPELLRAVKARDSKRASQALEEMIRREAFDAAMGERAKQKAGK
jgi:hypothetical protein